MNTNTTITIPNTENSKIKMWSTSKRFYISFLQSVNFQISFDMSVLPFLVDGLIELQNAKVKEKENTLKNMDQEQYINIIL